MSDSDLAPNKTEKPVPRFFFSYARRDLDKYLERFFYDLSEAVARKGGLDLDQGEVSFRDLSNIEPGDDWEKEIADGLQTSPVFVSIYSPWYFRREYCGKEFQVFITRDPNIRIEDETVRDSKAIIPLLWLDKRDLDRINFPPKALMYIQALDPDKDELDVRKKRGLRRILVNTGRRGRYVQCVDELADRILDVASKNPLPPLSAPPKLTAVKSIFHQPDALVTYRDSLVTADVEKARTPVSPMLGEGLRLMVLSYITSSDTLMASIGSASLLPSPLGTTPEGKPDSVGVAICAIASKYGFDCKEAVFTKPGIALLADIAEVLHVGRSRNAVTVLILDENVPGGLDQVALAEPLLQGDTGFLIIVVLTRGVKSGSSSKMRFSVEHLERALVHELNAEDPRLADLLADQFESSFIAITSRIVAEGSVQRAIDTKGPKSTPGISSTGRSVLS